MRVSIRPALIELWEIFRDRENTRLAIEVDSVSRVDDEFDLPRFCSKPCDLVSHGYSLPQLLGHEHAPGSVQNAAALSRAARRLEPAGEEIVGAECREQSRSLADVEVFSLDIPFNLIGRPIIREGLSSEPQLPELSMTCQVVVFRV
jgi:hypothetical protein